MKILRHADASQGREDWFTGQVEIELLKPATETSDLSISKVHFSVGSRSAWHTHPKGQTLYVTDGVGLVQRRGEPVQIIRPGDVVLTESGEEHWHGASSKHEMTHLAVQEVDDQGSFADWGEKVTDDEYDQQPES